MQSINAINVCIWVVVVVVHTGAWLEIKLSVDTMTEK